MISTQVNIPGYQVNEEIYNGSRTVVYRGYRDEQKPVAIKLLKNPYPSFGELLQFRNQYTIAKNLKSPLIIQTYSLEPYQNGYALVMELGGISLKDYFTNAENATSLNGGNPPRVAALHVTSIEFLLIAIALCNTLDILYHSRIIHKDIKPANILINPETKQVKLIDFSIASLLPQETQTLVNPNVLEGTLAYISPEQTGRMNRGIDYRTDFYSLGVTFYELLTGELPFQSNDPMDLVHCHIAKLPPNLRERGKEIPQVLGDIVMKLMAKNAEDRYQSALGLKFDLENCLYQLKYSSKIESFQIAQQDLCDRFIIPDKLYGRETEVETLLQAFERVSAGATEMMLVTGFSGIGKTAVVNEVHKPMVKQRGYFIKGKYDQADMDVDFLVNDLQKLLESMKVGAERICKIVLSLRNFSRLDEAEIKPVDIHSGIDSTLLILQHRLKNDSKHPPIVVIEEYSPLPLVNCYVSALNQVFMNILSNAIDALEESDANYKPTIIIRTEFQEQKVLIRIADNGVGMSESVKNKIFNPFFTTKPVGSGTGLGLSISYSIVVEKHGGQLSCISTPEEGTEFVIEIPV